MRKTLAAAALALSLSAAPAHAQPPGSEAVLERVVLVVRHGVRAPTQTAQALQALTGRPWPAWPVAAGELTDHGAQALGRMGERLRAIYSSEGLLPSGACPAQGEVQVWADGGDSRTRRSGEVLAQALAPDCGIVAGHGGDGLVDPLFDAAQPGVCPIDPAGARAALQARADPDGGFVRPQDARALKALQEIVAPQGCGIGGLCLGAPTTLAAGKKGVKLEGGLGLGATLSENLLLEYAQGFTPPEVGRGRAGSEAAIAAIIPVHERFADLMRRTPYMALRNGSVMARTVVDLLDGRAPSDPHAPKLSAGSKVVVIAGHDTNLSNLAGVFGLSWSFADEPDSTAPGTALAFEVWRDRITGAPEVRAVVYAQTLRQLRTASALSDADPPATATPRIGACSALARCTPDALRVQITAQTLKACGGA